MRALTISAIVLVVLIIGGSVYLHLGTKQLVEDVRKPASSDPVSTEKSDAPNPDNLPVESDSRSEKDSEPAWWDDAAQQKPGQKQTKDPWAALFTEETETEAVEDQQEEGSKDNGGSTESKKWDLEDPHQLREFTRAKYLEEHGDIPEIHIVADGFFKLETGGKMSPEEQLVFTEAMNYLHPDPATQRSIEIQKLIIAGDYDTLVEKYAVPEQPESEQPFIDVKPFFEGTPPHEALRQLRLANPERAAEFETFIREQAREDPSMSLEEVEEDIRRSYEPALGDD